MAPLGLQKDRYCSLERLSSEFLSEAGSESELGFAEEVVAEEPLELEPHPSPDHFEPEP